MDLKASVVPAERAAAWRTAAWLGRQVEVAVVQVELTLPQYRVLALLSEGSAVSSALAQRLAVRPPSVTAVIDGLVVRGLVERRHVADDRRCVALTLTEEGRGLLSAADRAVDERMSSLLDRLGDDDQAGQALEGLELWRRALLLARAERMATPS